MWQDQDQTQTMDRWIPFLSRITHFRSRRQVQPSTDTHSPYKNVKYENCSKAEVYVYEN